MSNTGALAAKDIGAHKGMTSRQIKAEMILNNITVKDIAHQAGVSISAVSQTITQYPSSRYLGLKVRPYIARALNRKVEEIWP